MKKRNLKQEKAKKERILSILEKERQAIIHSARRVAKILYEEKKEPITAWQVYEAMCSVEGIEEVLSKHDKRWLGAVFKTPLFTLVGYENSGSHSRIVAKWIPTEHKD
jgi:hypothetical protein